MIKFSCKNCGQKLSVKEEHSGKRIKCPKCGGVGVVPDASDPIKFHCENCGQSIRVPRIHAGKKGKCPKCKNPIIVPSLKKEPVESALSGPPIPSDADEDVYEDESDLPEEGRRLDRRLILIICGVAAVVIVGIIILITVILPSGSRSLQKPNVSFQREIPEADSQPQPVASDTEPAGTLNSEPAKEKVAPEEPVQSPVAASDEAGKLDLKLRLKPGQTYDVRVVREDVIPMTIKGGQQIKMNLINTTGLRFDVEHVDANDVASLKVTFLTIREIQKVDQNQIEFDSTKPDTAKSLSGETYSAMIGQSFVAKVGPVGRRLVLEGLDEMYSRIAETIVDAKDEGEQRESREERIEAKRKRIERDPRTGKMQVMDMVRSVFMPFPDGPIDIGDSWRAPTTILSISLYGPDDSTYTLRESGPAGTLVDISLKIEMEDKPLFEDSETTVTMTGSCEGSIEIDPNTGWMIRKNAAFNCSGEMRSPRNQLNPQGMVRPIWVENITTVEPMKED